MQLTGHSVGHPAIARRLTAFALAHALLLFLAACTMGPPAPAISVADDKFLPYRQYTTGRHVLIDVGGTRATELQARVDRKSGAVTTLVEVEIGYSSSHMYGFNQARNAGAASLPFASIFRHRSCKKGECDFDERFTVTIPEHELRATGAQGYALKIFAPAGESSTIVVQKAHIDELFAAIGRGSPA